MALTNSYIQVYGQLPQFFKKIRDGQAPDKFTRQYLKDLGFTSSNFNASIPLLKTLGFLSADGTPTARYHEYRNSARSRRVMGEAVKEAYGDLFTITVNPTEADRELIEGKFKSVHNATPLTAKLMASTFYALLGLADLSEISSPEGKKQEIEEQLSSTIPPKPETTEGDESKRIRRETNLHYNIQIHLPATKDVEVYNAIFKSLKGHLIE